MCLPVLWVLITAHELYSLSLQAFSVYMSCRCQILRIKLSHYHHRATQFLQKLDVELKNENLEMLLSCLSAFSKWAVVQQLHVVTFRFVLQYILTREAKGLKIRPIICFDKCEPH